MKLEIIIPAVIVLISALAYFFVIHGCNKQDNKSYNYFEFTCKDVGSASTTTPSAHSSNNRPRATSAPSPVVTNPPSTSPTSAPAAFTTSPPGGGGGSGGAVSGPEMDGQQCVSINQNACDTVGPWRAPDTGTLTGGGLITYQGYVSNACGSSSACPVCNECGMPPDNFNRTACEAALQARCSGSPTLHPDMN